MAQLPVTQTSSRGEQFVSRQMTQRCLTARQAARGRIVRRDLTQLRLSDELVAELLAADHLVTSTPVYNYNVPASLKSWIDHIVRKGLTLGMDGKGLLTSKKTTLLLASGGIYTEASRIRDRGIATRYLRMILNVIGIGDMTVVAGGGAKAVDLREQSMGEFVDKLQREIEVAAACSAPGFAQ